MLVEERNEWRRSGGRGESGAPGVERAIDDVLEVIEREKEGTGGRLVEVLRGAVFSLLVLIEDCDSESTASLVSSDCVRAGAGSEECMAGGDAAMTFGSTEEGRVKDCGKVGRGKSLWTIFIHTRSAQLTG